MMMMGVVVEMVVVVVEMGVVVVEKMIVMVVMLVVVVEITLQDKMVYTLCAKFPHGQVKYCVLD